MRAEAFLETCGRFPVVALAAIARRGIVVVAPHPDDEALGCGGLIALATEAGLPVRTIILSDGAGSHPNSRAFPRDKLVALRRRESEASGAILGLGLGGVAFLDLPDGAVPRSGAAIDAIIAAIRAIDADAVFVTWRFDPHCDHEAAAMLAEAAVAACDGVALYAYPIWGWTLPPGREVGAAPVGVRLDVSRHARVKAEAIAAHRSQIEDLIDDDPAGFRLSPLMLARFAGAYETFIETTPAATS